MFQIIYKWFEQTNKNKKKIVVELFIVSIWMDRIKLITKMREKIYILNANFVVDIKKTKKKIKKYI